ncbi:MAG: LysR family transcriptional regulator [Pseudomonas sp.]|nr:LysR family transcriptional regulator [Pseudomonas sp.]
MLPSVSSIFSRLRFRQLRLLIALGEQGSLIKAAELISISQPGATKALQEIETTLGAPLFVRTNRGLEANELGHCAIRYAKLIQTDLTHLREEMLGILQGHGGRLSVGVIMGAVPFMTDALTQLLEAHPDLSVEIVEDTSARLLSLLDQGRLDLAICRTSISRQPEHYDCIDVRDETLAVVANRDHPLAGRAQLELADLADSRWVVYSANMPMRLSLEREFQQAGLRFPLQLLETTSAFTTLSLLQKNPELVALLSTDVARFCTGFGMTCILPLSLQSRSEPYQLITRRGVSLSSISRLFMAQLTSAQDEHRLQ